MKTPLTRRQFLRTAGGVGAATLLVPARVPSAPDPSSSNEEDGPVRRKLIIIQFGGGTRSSESIDDPQHRLIPRLWNEMMPRGTLFTDMRVEHRVVHPNSTGSMMTGHWEWDDIDWSKPVAHPTIFEIYRKARNASDTATWAFVYASILAKTGESIADGYGPSYAANVIEPPTVPRSTSARMDRVMRDAASIGSPETELAAARECQRLARATSKIADTGLRSQTARAFLDREYRLWRSGSGTTSHDAFLADRAIACMRTFAPDVVVVDYGEIDCAHYGSWSRYVEAIRRTDELTWRVWRAAEQLPEYRGKALMLVMPDHGRELNDSGGSGFIHHSDFYTNKGADEGCRRVWMLAIGPGVRQGRKIGRPTPITCAAATGLEFLGLDTSQGAAESVLSATAS